MKPSIFFFSRYFRLASEQYPLSVMTSCGFCPACSSVSFTDYEMVMCPAYRQFARAAIRRGAAEVGMHLHAWNSPPAVPLTANDYQYGPYLIEYPESVMREKVHVLTGLLEEHFQMTPVSHRAGRWAFNEIYARILVEHGYRVDCSVAPRVSYRKNPGRSEKRRV